MKKSQRPSVVELPGIEGKGVAPVSIPRINKLCDAYIRERDKRCAQTPNEVAAKQKLIEAIHAHADQIGKDRNGELVYRYGETVIILKPGKETLKVKEVSAEEGETE